MAMPSENEFNLIKKIMICIIILNLTTIMFAYMAGSALGVDCSEFSTNPACQLQNLSNGLNKTATNIAQSFTCPNNKAQYYNATACPITPISNSNYFAPIVNLLIAIPNYTYHFSVFFGGIIVILIQIVYLVLFVLLALLPAIFASGSFGIFAPIFSIIYLSTSVIIICYALYLVANRIMQFFGSG